MTQTIESQPEAPPLVAATAIQTAEGPARKRPRPGERRIQILQTLAGMLEHPRGEKITTAALAAKLSVSEAALYRHFASKAQMFEGLIGFIEQTVFGLINQITTQEEHGLRQVQAIVRMLLSFAEKNSRHDARADRRGAGGRARTACRSASTRWWTASRRRCASASRWPSRRPPFPADADIPARAR